MATMNNGYSNIAARQPSAHRGVLYAAGLPGWGEMHAGARLQGLGTLLAFLAAMALFCWAAWLMVEPLTAFEVPPESTMAMLGYSFLAMLGLWLWGMFNAARTARQARSRLGLPMQCSPAWGAAFSWICPGCGQAYAGKTLFGVLLLLLALCGTALMAPALREMGNSIHGLLLDPSSAGNPLYLASRIEEIFFVLHNSLPSFLLEAIRMASIAEAVSVLYSQRMEQAEEFAFDQSPRRWYTTIEARAGGLFLLGWIAPGAGQLMLGRRYGWLILGLYLGLQLALAVSLRQKLLELPLAMSLSWAPTIIKFAAMLEAPIRLIASKPAATVHKGDAKQ